MHLTEARSSPATPPISGELADRNQPPGPEGGKEHGRGGVCPSVPPQSTRRPAGARPRSPLSPVEGKHPPVHEVDVILLLMLQLVQRDGGKGRERLPEDHLKPESKGPLGRPRTRTAGRLPGGRDKDAPASLASRGQDPTHPRQAARGSTAGHQGLNHTGAERRTTGPGGRRDSPRSSRGKSECHPPGRIR